MHTQNNYYQEGFPQLDMVYDPTECNARDANSVMTIETEPSALEDKSHEVSQQVIGPLPLWTPELYADPKTGEMHSKPGDATIYTNGLEYPLIQLYIDSKVARNMPENRTIWNRNAPFPTPPQPKPETDYQHQEFQDQELQGIDYRAQEYQGQAYQVQDYQRREYQRQVYQTQDYQGQDYQEEEYHEPNPDLLPITDHDHQTFSPHHPHPHYLPRWVENNNYWPLVHEIYGTAIGIILKCMARQLPHPPDPFTQDRWLQSQGLPYPATRRLLDRYYFPSRHFRQVGDRVACRGRKRRELKERINKGVEAGKWPGDTDFSEMRNTFEILRKKGLEFLERWGDMFEMEWVAAREQQRKEGYYS